VRSGLIPTAGLAALLIACTAGIAAAQTPSQADPGVIFREELPRPDYEIVPGPVIRKQQPQEAPRGADQIRFDLVSVEVKGVTVYDDAAIGALLDPLVGQEVSVGDLYRLANSITSLYASDDRKRSLGERGGRRRT